METYLSQLRSRLTPLRSVCRRLIISTIRAKWIIGVAAVVAATLACNLGPANGTDEPVGEAETAIALTVAARLQQTEQAGVGGTGTATEIATESLPAVPTETPEPPVFDTPTPVLPEVSVSVDTNCRTGPGKVYLYRGALLVGETAEVVARSTVPDYWYIPNPDRPGEFCYLWGRYATVSGNTQVLPEFTPMPSPTPTYTPKPSVTPTPSYTP